MVPLATRTGRLEGAQRRSLACDSPRALRTASNESPSLPASSRRTNSRSASSCAVMRWSRSHSSPLERSRFSASRNSATKRSSSRRNRRIRSPQSTLARCRASLSPLRALSISSGAVTSREHLPFVSPPVVGRRGRESSEQRFSVHFTVIAVKEIGLALVGHDHGVTDRPSAGAARAASDPLSGRSSCPPLALRRSDTSRSPRNRIRCLA